MSKVGIIMGSDSDLPKMEAGIELLKEFGVKVEVRIVSAHRTPDAMKTYAKSAEKRGVKVIIAGAGGAAHLPGMMASLTYLPVIGVPIQVGSLKGLDALLSVAQMPKGIPVATVAVDNSANAGLLAVRMLAQNSASLRTKMRAYQKNMKTKVTKADKRVKRLYT